VARKRTNAARFLGGATKQIIHPRQPAPWFTVRFRVACDLYKVAYDRPKTPFETTGIWSWWTW